MDPHNWLCLSFVCNYLSMYIYIYKIYIIIYIYMNIHILSCFVCSESTPKLVNHNVPLKHCHILGIPYFLTNPSCGGRSLILPGPSRRWCYPAVGSLWHCDPAPGETIDPKSYPKRCRFQHVKHSQGTQFRTTWNFTSKKMMDFTDLTTKQLGDLSIRDITTIATWHKKMDIEP